VASRPALKIYYDASCPLCRAEFHALKDADDDDRLVLVDCSERLFADGCADRDGVDRAAMMEAIHVRDASGNWYRGVDAFQKIYTTMGMHSLARFWGSTRLRPALEPSYAWFARNRQPLSRLRLHRAFGWLMRRLALNARKRQTASDSDP